MILYRAATSVRRSVFNLDDEPLARVRLRHLLELRAPPCGMVRTTRAQKSTTNGIALPLAAASNAADEDASNGTVGRRQHRLALGAARALVERRVSEPVRRAARRARHDHAAFIEAGASCFTFYDAGRAVRSSASAHQPGGHDMQRRNLVGGGMLAGAAALLGDAETGPRRPGMTTAEPSARAVENLSASPRAHARRVTGARADPRAAAGLPQSRTTNFPTSSRSGSTSGKTSTTGTCGTSSR